MPELIYRIDKELSARDGALSIRIEYGTTTPPLSSAALRKLAPSADNAVISFLIAEELKFQKARTGASVKESDMTCNLLHVAYAQTLQAIQLLSTTNRVYFQQTRLVIDIYGRTNFHFLVDHTPEGKLAISGQIKTATKQFNIRDCDFLCGGPPHFFIKGISLQFIGPEVSWNLLKQAYNTPETLHLLDIQEELFNDDIKCDIVFTGNAQEIFKHTSQPKPVLMLRDRMGAFADLWMDYGNDQLISMNAAPTKRTRRDRKSELGWEKDLLESDFTKKTMATSNYYCPLDKISKSLLFLLELGWKVIDIKGNQVVHQGKAELDLTTQDQSILVRGKIKYGTFSANLSDVVGSFNRRERFVELGSGVVGLLPQQWSQTGLNGIEDGELVTDGVKIKSNRLGTLSDIWDSTTQINMDEKLSSLKTRLQSFQGIAVAKPGSEFCGELRPYQQEGLNWLAFLYEFGFHGILADDMGLGKTVQVLAFLSHIEISGPILVVMPTSLIFNWQREIERFFPTMPVYKHHGPDRNKGNLPSNGIILTSYTTLRIDLPLFIKTHFQCIILDEAQAIKNPHTQSAQAAFALNGRFRLSITGTPIENNLNEMWSHFRFLMPDLLGDEKNFLAEMQSAASDPRYLQRIKKKIRPFILRRTKNEVAKDLPERIEQVVWVEMSPSQRKIYEDFLAGVKGNLFKKVSVEGVAKHRMEIFEAILRLRQICCHPLLVSSNLDKDQECTSGKFDALMDDIETAVKEGRKTLVYSQFTSMLAVISKEMNARGLKFSYLDGSTVDREKVVNEFQNDASIPLFLISLKAGGIGLNLTAADYVFLYDPWWNEAIENQAIDRAHRIGRKDVVIAKRYVAVESIEEKMMKLKAAKRSLIDDILDSEMGSTNLTDEDFQYLLS